MVNFYIAGRVQLCLLQSAFALSHGYVTKLQQKFKLQSLSVFLQTDQSGLRFFSTEWKKLHAVLISKLLKCNCVRSVAWLLAA
ncbi:hypothetical protein T08_15984 [Trichinella sp. T8]|nr:hypothetical protein T08_12226 [Trichinella sp. T8]KRZ91733.1 hypothetical protein T08_15984 [Trichinella sp. T8]